MRSTLWGTVSAVSEAKLANALASCSGCGGGFNDSGANTTFCSLAANVTTVNYAGDPIGLMEMQLAVIRYESTSRRAMGHVAKSRTTVLCEF
jgi:hypothetical protein